MRRWLRAVALLAAALACFASASPALAAQKQQDGQAKSKPDSKGQAKPKPETPAEKLGIEAKAWGLIDARTGEVLISQAGNERLPIASTTKLMTAYVAMKEMPLDKVVRAAPYDAEYGESLLEMRTGQEISVRDLIYGLILRSGNDAAHTLAIAPRAASRASCGR